MAILGAMITFSSILGKNIVLHANMLSVGIGRVSFVILLLALSTPGVVIFTANSAHASATAEEIDRLGKDLTPLGAERAGNADGTIPKWTGGITAPPPGLGYQVDGPHLDPFADDQVITTITKENYSNEEFASLLSVGQKAMFDYIPDFRMPLYPTRRSCGYDQIVYDAIKYNAAAGELEADGYGVNGARLASPFPIPKSGLELLWNHTLRFRGFKIRAFGVGATPTRSGSYTLIKSRVDAVLDYSRPGLARAEDVNNNVSIYVILNTLSPARFAGNVLLVHETINLKARQRQVWLYNPGQRRVRRAPNVAYDFPQVNSDGLATTDQTDMFNGAPDRFEWKMLGKQEMYIPYNAYKLASSDLEYSDIIKAGTINPDHMRYERHRVWGLQGVRKEGVRHLYRQRDLYIDEDSWNIVVGDHYDDRGEIWRVQLGPILNFYEVPLCAQSANISHDLLAGRYSLGGLRNQEKAIDWKVDNLGYQHFTPDAIRRMGIR